MSREILSPQRIIIGAGADLDQSEGCLGFDMVATADDLHEPSPFNIPFRPLSPQHEGRAGTLQINEQITAGDVVESVPVIRQSLMIPLMHDEAREMNDKEEDKSQSRCKTTPLLQDNTAVASMFNQVEFRAHDEGLSFNFDEETEQAQSMQLPLTEDLNELPSTGISQFSVQLVPPTGSLTTIPPFTYTCDKAPAPPTLSNAPLPAANTFAATMKSQIIKPYQVSRMSTSHPRRLAAHVHTAGGPGSGMKYVVSSRSNPIAKPVTQSEQRITKRHGRKKSKRLDAFAQFEEAPGSNMLGQMLPTPKEQTQRQATPKKIRWSAHLSKFFHKTGFD